MELSDIKGIGRKKQELLAGMGICTLEDMLTYFPVSYEDHTGITPAAELKPGGNFYVLVTVRRILRGRGRGGFVKIAAEDGTGTLEIVFFRASYMASSFRVGENYYVYGKVTKSGSTLQMIHPGSVEPEEQADRRILPVYRASRGVSQKDLRRVTEAALAELSEDEETLPRSILEKRHVAGRTAALRNIHFPADRKSYAAARYRLIYEELFLFQTGMNLLTGSSSEKIRGFAFPHDDYIWEFEDYLGFRLTGAQKKVLEEIEHDMESDTQMQRLLQGDVGSGKTAVAAAVLYKAARNGCQGALMAPTELLASQHYQDFQKLFRDTGLKIGYLVSGMDRKQREEMLRGMEDGSISVVVGTHALIQEEVRFADLGVVVTDEQHRFGVRQRVGLAAKGMNPDNLVMTATPIPRSLAAVLYNGMDLSVIDELPAGRKPVITKALSLRSRNSVYRQVEEHLRAGEQVYVVAPLITDSEQVDAASAESVYRALRERFPDHPSGLVHGGMKQSEKDAVMKAFANGQIRILAATVVIEVGINVPSATVMVIENAERFGLAQLHQLRGRVGRSSKQSFCYLLTDEHSGLGMERAKVLASTQDGFAIAEKDLEMRGPGDLTGTRQHGVPQLFVSDLLSHSRIYEAAREDVEAMFKEDPSLRQTEHGAVGERAVKMFDAAEGIGL